MKQQLRQYRQLIQTCGHRDRQALLKRLNQFSQIKKVPDSRFKNDIRKAQERLQSRSKGVPDIHFNQQLPINEHLQSIQEKLQQHQVLVICGETGSGKTTQLPKICLKAGFGIKGYIGHTQPRRIAAKTIAARVSEELNSPMGNAVGYKIRHSDNTSESSYIKVMTDGVLLAEMQNDRYLNEYDVLIIDEAHERSLNIDFILGYLKQLLDKRPELRLIITSATIDVERFSEHFNNAPIIEVSGRTFPVEVRYRPIESDSEDSRDLENEEALLDAIQELGREDLGDILVFVDGERGIHDLMSFLRKQKLPNTEVLPLYARLGNAGQAKVFRPHKKRHIILSTNVAETSLTINGIRYVIDFGYARISRYSYRSKVQRLPIEKISQASANQRMGRCGRTSEGICIRLYSEEDFEQRPIYTEPEILRTNLASVILQMKSLKLGNMDEFPFIAPPNQRFVNDGIRLLKEIRAIDSNEQMTRIGKQLARLPIDPRYGRMLLAANDWHCMKEVLVLVSALSIQDPRERPVDEPEKADKAHARFHDPDSDFGSFLNLWNFYQKHKGDLSNNRLKKLCKTNFLSVTRLREWHDVHKQLKDLVVDMKLKINTDDAGYNNIHCALITGLLSQIAVKNSEREYTGARNIKLHIFPGSNLFKTLPKWIMAGELSETSRLYGRNVAKIDPLWLLKPAKHLLKHSYSEPHWDEKKQTISAHETISLYGLVIVPKQNINYAKVNSAEARKLFIVEGLVRQRLESNAKFYSHNRNVISEVQELENKARRQDILDEDALFEFYDRLLPEAIASLQTLDGWRKNAERDKPDLLLLDKKNLMRRDATEITYESYPDIVQINHLSLPVEYRFKPGEENDGVNIDIALPMLNQFSNTDFESLVPGILEEKIIALIKSLPKQLRRQFVPVPDVAKQCALSIQDGDSSLAEKVANYLFRTRGVKVTADDMRLDSVPDYLQTNIRIIDEQGELVAQDRNINRLKEKFKDTAAKQFSSAVDWEIEKNNLIQWDFGDLPETIEHKAGVTLIKGYPALVDEQKSVSIKILDTHQKAISEMRPGLRRLYILNLDKEIKYLRKNIPGFDKIKLYSSQLYQKQGLLNEIIEALVDSLFIDEYGLTRTQNGFQEILEKSRSRLYSESVPLSALLSDIFRQWHDIRITLKKFKSVSTLKSIADIRLQLDNLIYPGFIKQTPHQWLMEYPRYLSAVTRRIEKLEFPGDKERINIHKIQPIWPQYEELHQSMQSANHDCTELVRYRWMIEEYRVSLFAQELKTKLPVSKERLEKQLQKIRKA